MSTLWNRRLASFALFAAVIVVCALPILRAQDPAQAPAPAQAQAQPSAQDQAAAPAQPGVVIKKESRLVLVDAVVTDKKGNYVRDLAQKDFKVYEDNKEQQVASFSTGADMAQQANAQKHYLILFFDNSSMAAPDQ